MNYAEDVPVDVIYPQGKIISGRLKPTTLTPKKTH